MEKRDHSVTKVICLIVQSGPLKGHKYFVKADCPILIGRAEEANIRLPRDKFCSRSHAVVFWEKSACYVKDLESTNGTYVNKVKVLDNVKLENKDMITFGSTDVLVLISNSHETEKPLMDVV